METYEQKYERALKQAKQELKACGSLDCDAARQIFRLFPELQKSEDERVKTNIIKLLRFVRDTHHQYFDECNEAINWFEKQSEQRPTDKVKPKFKVGDWVVLEDSLSTYKIVEVCKSWYEVISNNDGMQYSIGFDEEDDCHLWTIYDAKRGDILQANKCTLIFDSLSKDSDNTTEISSWYFCDTKMFFGNDDNYISDLWDTTGVVPATKEQRDFLFAKMKEAGYEWDSNKKELIRYEQ